MSNTTDDPSSLMQAVERHQVREVLKCLLHTILFNRALGLVRPRDMHLQLLDLTYVECGDDAVDAKVNAALASTDAFVARSLPPPQTAAPQPSTSRRHAVSFFRLGAPTNEHMIAMQAHLYTPAIFAEGEFEQC